MATNAIDRTLETMLADLRGVSATADDKLLLSKYNEARVEQLQAHFRVTALESTLAEYIEAAANVEGAHQKQLEALEAQITWLRDRNDALAADNLELAALQAENERLTLELQSRKIQFSEELRTATSNNRGWIAVNKQLAKAGQQAKADLERVRNDLDTQLHNLECDYDDLNREQKRLLKRNADLEATCGKLESEAQRATVKAKHYTKLYEEVQVELEVLQEQQERVESRTTPTAQTSSTSAPIVSAVPQIAVVSAGNRVLLADIEPLAYSMPMLINDEITEGCIIVRGFLKDLSDWKILLKSDENISRVLDPEFVGSVDTEFGYCRYFRTHNEVLRKGDVIFVCQAELWNESFEGEM